MAVTRTVKEVFLPGRKRIALVAHDNRKIDLIDWARFNAQTLACHELFATGTTGRLLTEQLGLDVCRLQPQPHDPNVKALLRVAVVWNIPVACNRATADFMISSPLITAPYSRLVRIDGDDEEQALPVF